MSTIVITIDGVDVTPDVIYSTAVFTASTGAQPGDFDIQIKDPPQFYSFDTGQIVTLDIDGVRSFDGYVMSAERDFFFPVTDTINETQVLRWHLRGPDVNILFQRRVVFDSSDGREAVPLSPEGTTDLEALNALVNNYLDLSSDNLTFNLNEVGVITPDRAGQPYQPGDSWLGAMYFISQLPGAVWGIKPDRTFYYEDDSTESAPFRLSDTPNNSTTFGYSNFEWLEDGTKLANDAPSWGAGTGSPTLVYSRTQDSASIAAHGRWQQGHQYFGSVYRQATIDAISDAVVYGSPQNLHGGKDDSVYIRCRIKKPGLSPGDKVHIRSNVFDVSGVYPIRRMMITTPTPTDALFDLDLSYDIDRPNTYYDPPKQIHITIPDYPDGGDPPPPPPWPDGLCVFDNFEDRTQDGWGTASSGTRWGVTVGTGAPAPALSVADGVGWITIPGAQASSPFYANTTAMLPLPDVSAKEFEVAFAMGFTPPVGMYSAGWDIMVGSLGSFGSNAGGIVLQFQAYSNAPGPGWNLLAYDAMGLWDDYGTANGTFDYIGGFVEQDLASLEAGVTIRIVRTEDFVSVEAEGIQKFILETTHQNSQQRSVQFQVTGPSSTLVGGPDIPVWIDGIRGKKYSPPRASITLDDFNRVSGTGWGSTPDNKGEWIALPNPPDPLGDLDDYTSAVTTGGGIFEFPINYTLWTLFATSGNRYRYADLFPLDVWDPTNAVIEFDVYMPGHALLGNEMTVYLQSSIGYVEIRSSTHTSTVQNGTPVNPYDIDSTYISVGPDDHENPRFTLLQSGIGLTDGVVLLNSPVHVRVQRTGTSLQSSTVFTVAGLTKSFITNWDDFNGPGVAEAWGYPFYISLQARMSFNDDAYYSPFYESQYSTWNSSLSTIAYAYFDNLQINGQSVTCGSQIPTPIVAKGCETPSLVSGTTYEVNAPFVAFSLEVYLNGARQNLGLHYTEDASNGRFTLVTSPGDIDSYLLDLYVCYEVAP